MTKYFFVTFISIFLFGCFESNTVLARVNNKTLKQSDLKYLNIDKKNQEQFIHEWVKLQLLASSVKENPIINLKANFNKAKMKANIFVSNLLKNKEINKEDLLNYYKVNYQNFYEVVPKYKFQKIYVSTKKKKNIIINKISENTGIKFSDLAKDYSEDIFGKNGGYTGFAQQNNFPLVTQIHQLVALRSVIFGKSFHIIFRSNFVVPVQNIYLLRRQSRRIVTCRKNLGIIDHIPFFGVQIVTHLPAKNPQIPLLIVNPDISVSLHLPRLSIDFRSMTRKSFHRPVASVFHLDKNIVDQINFFLFFEIGNILSRKGYRVFDNLYISQKLHFLLGLI